MNVARRLRLAGKTVEMYMEPSKKVGKAFNYADRVGAVKVAFVAPDEWAKGLVRVKDLRSFGPDVPDDAKQKDVPLEDLANVDGYFGQAPPAAPASAAKAAAPAQKAKAVAANEAAPVPMTNGKDWPEPAT